MIQLGALVLLRFAHGRISSKDMSKGDHLKERTEVPSRIQTLKKLNHSIWRLERQWWYLRGEIAKRHSVSERASKQWRSNPRWYMHQIPAKIARIEGAVAAMVFKCCVSRERETSSLGELGIGPCAVECACCCKA